MKNKRIKIKETIKEHVVNNRKEYIIVALLFIIGIFLGVLFVNNIRRNTKSRNRSLFKQFCK